MGEGEFEQEPAEKAVFHPSPVYASEGGEVLVGKRAGDYEPSPLLKEQHISLCETLDRVLNTGVVVHGDITISVANIDLIYIGLKALLTSVETARRTGINHMTDF
ncbi:MAG: gas vesicle protein [Planctomycetes bacterium]|nr:gas vesicle protein [Planctomycetota bacterium]